MVSSLLVLRNDSFIAMVPVTLIVIIKKRQALCLRSSLHILSREDSAAGINGGLHCSFYLEKTILFVGYELHMSFFHSGSGGCILVMLKPGG